MIEERFTHEEPPMDEATPWAEAAPRDAAHQPVVPPMPEERATADAGPPGADAAPAHTPRQARAGGGGPQRRGPPVVARWNTV